jgi:hypothetical protein
VTAFLIVSILALLWMLSLYFKPFGRCWACGGRGVRVVRGGRRARKCWLCKGHRRRQRLGSRTVHKIRRQVAAHWRGPR